MWNTTSFWSITALIKPVLPQAAQKISNFFKVGKTVELQLLKAPGLGHITEDKGRKRPSTQRESNPQSLCYEAYPLPLCYNRCQTTRLGNRIEVTTPTLKFSCKEPEWWSPWQLENSLCWYHGFESLWLSKQPNFYTPYTVVLVE